MMKYRYVYIYTINYELCYNITVWPYPQANEFFTLLTYWTAVLEVYLNWKIKQRDIRSEINN